MLFEPRDDSLEVKMTFPDPEGQLNINNPRLSVHAENSLSRGIGKCGFEISVYAKMCLFMA